MNGRVGGWMDTDGWVGCWMRLTRLCVLVHRKKTLPSAVRRIVGDIVHEIGEYVCRLDRCKDTKNEHADEKRCFSAAVEGSTKPTTGLHRGRRMSHEEPMEPEMK